MLNVFSKRNGSETRASKPQTIPVKFSFDPIAFKSKL